MITSVLYVALGVVLTVFGMGVLEKPVEFLTILSLVMAISHSNRLGL